MNDQGFDLLVDDLSLMEADYGLYAFNVLAQDATFGNPQPVAEQVESLMRDGDLSTATRDGNRQQTFLVEISAIDAGAAAEGEAALMAHLDRPAALTWVTPYAADSVFDVVRSWSEFRFDDLSELGRQGGRVKRVFALTFEALPYARSVDPVTINWTGANRYFTVNRDAFTVGAGTGTLAARPGLFFTRTGKSRVVTTSQAIPMEDFLGIMSAWQNYKPAADVKINGTPVPVAYSQKKNPADSNGTYRLYDTSAWRGQEVTLEFTLFNGSSTLNGIPSNGLLTTPYPNLAGEGLSNVWHPRGIGIIDVPGSARSPIALLSASIPAGGAFLYTGPDPLARIRAGASELRLKRWVQAGGDPIYLPGTYAKTVERSTPRPPILSAGTLWPQYVTEYGVASTVSHYAFPVAQGNAVSYLTGGGPIISASPEFPAGVRPTAIVYEEPVLHSGRCGFALLDQYGNPIPCAITFYPHWRHHAGQ